MEQVRLAGRMRQYINSALMRNEAVGLSPNLTVSVPVPVVNAAGEQVVDAEDNLVTGKEVVIYSVLHMQHNAQRTKQWMSREGLIQDGDGNCEHRGGNVFIKLAFAYEVTTQCPRTDRKPRYLLDRCAASSVFRFRLLLFLSCFPYTRSYTCSTMPSELSNGCRVKG